MANVARRVNAAWLQPISTEPALLVNREKELERLTGYLEELRATGLREGHVLLSGARGVGKSIFTRTALARFQRAHGDHAVCITVDCRGLKYRPFLSNLARALIDAIRPSVDATSRKDLAVWLDQLNLFATLARGHARADRDRQPQIRRARVGRRGSGPQAPEPLCLGRAAQPRDDAIEDHRHGRAAPRRHRGDARPAGGREDAVARGHLLRRHGPGRLRRRRRGRREAVSSGPRASPLRLDRPRPHGDAGRERQARGVRGHRTSRRSRRTRSSRSSAAGSRPHPRSYRSSSLRDPTGRRSAPLASLTGNALVFLRWAYGLLRTQSWPPAASWTDDASLEQIVRTAEPLADEDGELIHRVVRIMDQCDGGRPEIVVRREHLLLGGSASQQPGPEPPHGGGSGPPREARHSLAETPLRALARVQDRAGPGSPPTKRARQARRLPLPGARVEPAGCAGTALRARFQVHPRAE